VARSRPFSFLAPRKPRKTAAHAALNPMKSPTRYPLEQWAEARRLHGKGIAFPAIADRLGIRASSLRARASKEGWPQAPATGTPATPRTVRPRRPSPATARILRALAVRLYSVIDIEIRTTELRMKRQLDNYQQSPDGASPPPVTKAERESFAALVESINLVTEMASEPALAADGRRKYATLNPELTALSDELDADALAAASQKDELRREIADELEKLVPPPRST